MRYAINLGLGLAIIAGSANAYAQVYKCTGSGGKIQMQQVPCLDSGEKMNVRPASGAAPPDSSNKAASPATTTLIKDANARVAIRTAINENRPLMGMILGELDQALGLPQSINTTTYATGSTQQRVYYFKDVTWYVYVKAGLVTSFQSTLGGLGATSNNQPCPSAFEIRSVETSASSITLSENQRLQYARQLTAMRSCGVGSGR